MQIVRVEVHIIVFNTVSQILSDKNLLSYRSRYYDDDGFNGLWTLSVIGPLLHILALAHVMLWGRPSSILGSIVSFVTNFSAH